MTTNTRSTANKPVYRLGFAPRTGTDRNSQPTLGYPIEIGAVFPRKDAEKGLIAKFQIVPQDFQDGVLLLMPVKQEDDLLSRADKAA